MLGFLTNTTAKAVESVAKEWIETSGEKAEANALMVKTLDPNGLMRRDISNKVSWLYVLYLLVTMMLVLCQSFGAGEINEITKAINSLTDLFLPITGMFTTIVGASFGVNWANVKGNK